MACISTTSRRRKPVVVASGLSAGAIQFAANGNDGNDVLVGSAGKRLKKTGS
jgi:hypothetical protein